MIFQRIRAHQRHISMLLCGLILAQLVPWQAKASGGGPVQPEFSMFQSAGTPTSVDAFSGDFSFNLPLLTVPGPEGAGYPLSLSYRSGERPDAEASWVGFGWSLGPGAVTRNLRGHPDDHKGQTVSYLRKSPESHTVSVGTKVGLQAFDIDAIGASALSLSLGKGFRFNNLTGFSEFYSIGGSFAGLMNASYAVSQGRATFQVSADPLAFLARVLSAYNSNQREQPAKQWARTAEKTAFKWGSSTSTANFARELPSAVSWPTETKHTEGSVTVQVNGLPIPLGGDVGLTGSVTKTTSTTGMNLPAFGYLYSGSRTKGNEVQDFAYENDQPYEYRQLQLPMPVSQPDIFNASAEGVGGSFRFYHNRVGSYAVNQASSNTSFYTLGGQLQVGTDFGVGGTAAIAYEELETKGWNDQRVAFSATNPLYHRTFMRFTGDKAGLMEYTTQAGPIVAGFDPAPVINNTQPNDEFMPSLPTDLQQEKPFELRRAASSIAYHTNADMIMRPEVAVTRPSETGSLVSRTETPIRDGVGEVVIHNPQGQQYVFGLPVYARNEYQFSIGPKNPVAANDPIAFADLATGTSNNPKQDLDAGLPFIQGQFRPDAYATSWLLSKITSPDYVDLTNDGPTADDAGAWTKFDYERAIGSNLKADAAAWYRWRSPYNGYHFSRNELQNQNDDRLSVAGGEREVYYLKSIETKTHIARFITEARDDAREAAPENTADNSATARGTKGLKRLQRIDLYAKATNGGTETLIQSVIFEYGYDAFPGQLDHPSGLGKLTLRSVKVIYAGVYEMKPTKYSFGYAYANPLHSGTLAHTAYNKFWTEKLPTSPQAPAATRSLADAWGNFDPRTQANAAQLRYGSDQRTFAHDPAAWQLKVIKHPSGSQTHIFYEQDRYRFVQDQPAMAMVGLRTPNVDNLNDNSYSLNLADWGLPMPCPEATLDRLKRQIEAQFIQKKEKVFFRFHYALTGSTANLTPCSAFIEGFADLKSVEKDLTNGTLKLSLGRRPNGSSEQATPRELCVAHANAGLLGMAGISGCTPRLPNASGDAEEAIRSFAQIVAGSRSGTVCAAMDLGRSQIRLPMPVAKMGGGLRVNRILTYDPGLEPNFVSETLNGQEYYYLDRDGNESGVATAEPSELDKECALYRVQPMGSRDFSDRTVGGVLLEQAAGIPGMGLLPAPSVGYGSVYMTDIYHSPANGAGFSHKEFHTAREFPMVVTKSELAKRHRDYNLQTPIASVVTPKLWVNQGYEIVLNDMHGQAKLVSTHGGEYLPGPVSQLNAYTVTWDSMAYYAPTAVPVQDRPDQLISTMALGLEEEIVPAGRLARQQRTGGSADMEFTVAWIGVFPLVYPITIPQLDIVESIYASHVTTRVRRHPAYASKVWSMRDGMRTEIENVAYSSITGEPSLVRSTDGHHGFRLLASTAAHDGQRLDFTHFAGAAYPAMGQRSVKEGRWYGLDEAVKATVTASNTIMLRPNQATCAGITLPERGDRLRIYYDGVSQGDFIVTTERGIFLDLIPATTTQAALTPQRGCQAITVEMIRTVRSNRVLATAGSLSTYGSGTLLSVPATLPTPLTSLVGHLNTKLAEAVAAPGTPKIASGSAYAGITYKLDTAGTCEGYSDMKSPASITCTYTNTAGCPVLKIEGSVSSNARYIKVEIPGYTGGGRFAILPSTGRLVFFTSTTDCIGVPVGKLQFCGLNAPRLFNVLAASATTWTDMWSPSGVTTLATHQQGLWGRWRTQAELAYRDVAKSAFDPTPVKGVYDKAGTVAEMPPYNHGDPRLNDSQRWLMSTLATQYAQGGSILETRDILGRYSAVQYGHVGGLYNMSAQNAGKGEIWFEGYEVLPKSDATYYYFPNGYELNKGNSTWETTLGHSGGRSLSAAAGTFFFLPSALRTVTKPVRVSAWVRYATPSASADADASKITMGNTTQAMKHVARVGEWNLLEAVVTPSALASAWYIKNGTTGKAWLDDLRVQPLDASGICTVYDATTLRIVAQFDDNHFGQFFQYDAEGRLVRRLLETERGLKVAEESHTHLKNAQN